MVPPQKSGSNWNLDMLVFEERGKPKYPEENLSEQRREPTTNSTHIWRRARKLIPSHIGGRRVLSPLRHPCSLKITRPLFFCFCFYQYRDRERERQNERERLVSEGIEQTEQDHDIEMNGVDKSSEHEEPLLEKTFESSTESFDPLYDRVTRKAPDREVPPVPSTSEDGPKPEPPIYQVLGSELKTMAPSQKLGAW